MLVCIDENCKKPTRGTKYSAGVDLYARERVYLEEGAFTKIPLGVKIDLSTMYDKFSPSELETFKRSFLIELRPRSSARLKGLISHSGIIDLDYKDEFEMIVYNPKGNRVIEKDDKIAQIILKEHHTDLFGITTEEERAGGFGSTGL